MKNFFKAAVAAAIFVLFVSLSVNAQTLPGVVSGDTVKVRIERPSQRVVTRTVDRTETVTAEAITDLQRSVKDLGTSLTILANNRGQERIASTLEAANAYRWRWYEIIGLMTLSLLGLWGVLSALDLNRIQVQVQQPQPAPVPPVPAPVPTNDEIRAIILETLGEGIYGAYAAPRGIAVQAGGNVTIVTYGATNSPWTPPADAAPAGERSPQPRDNSVSPVC